VEFLASLAPHATRRESLAATLDALHQRCEPFVETWWSELSTIDGVTLYGPPPTAPRTATIGFTIAGVPSSSAASQLADRGVFVSHGNFYAQTVIERLELAPEGLIRAGCACYTTGEEVARLISGVREIAARV
jgi:selenocysteine lyase/cysteine desulfurase